MVLSSNMMCPWGSLQIQRTYIFFLSLNTFILMEKQVGGSVLPASVISLYCMYLCYSGLASEPRDYECNGLHKHSKAVSTGTLALGLLTTVLSVVYSAVRAGSSTTLLSPPSSPRAGKSQLIYLLLLFRILQLF